MDIKQMFYEEYKRAFSEGSDPDGIQIVIRSEKQM